LTSKNLLTKGKRKQKHIPYLIVADAGEFIEKNIILEFILYAAV